MDLKRLKKAYDHLESLDDRMTYKVRPRAGALTRPGIEQISEEHRILAEYTIELKEVVRDLIMALASRPKAQDKPQGS